MKLIDWLTKTGVLEVVDSKYNGELKVIKDVTWGTYIRAGGLTQSGGIVKDIWNKTLGEVVKIKPHVNSCLILGLGGGSVARLVRQYWVTSEITGIDIDKKIVKLGEKYMKLNEVNLKIKIGDANRFISTSKKKYDLILIDLYNGDNFPEKFEKDTFIKNTKKRLNKNGIVVFNRLYGGDHRPGSVKFARKLEKYFKKVDYIYPQANLDLICYN